MTTQVRSVPVGRVALAVLLLATTLPAAAQGGPDVGRAEAVAAEMRGQLVPRRFTTLSSELAARIERLPAQEGDHFKEGQVLVALDCAIQRAQLDEVRAALQGAEKTLSVNRRLHTMHAGGALEAEVAAAEVAKVRARIAAGAATVAKCVLAAPFPGRVVELKVREQQFVQAGQAMIEILDDSVLEVEFLVPSRWLAWLKPGHAFEIAVDETGRGYPARVIRLGARVDAVSQSVKVVGAIRGAFPELMAGMSGRIQIRPPE